MPGSQALWDTLRRDPAPRTAVQLCAASGCGRGTVDQRLRYWRAAGFVERIGGKVGEFRLRNPAAATATAPRMKRGGAEATEPATGPIWRAMRVLSKRGSFDVPMLAMIAKTTPTYAQNYLNRLRRAGYVRLIDGREKWNTDPASFRLIRDTGPRAPRIGNAPGRMVLIDDNTGARVDISPGRVSLRSKPHVAIAGGGVG